MTNRILQIWQVKDLKKLIQAHAGLDRNGIFYLQPVNNTARIWLETRPENGAPAHTISTLTAEMPETNLEQPLAFSTDLANLKTFLHDAETLTLQRDGDTLTWTKQTKNGSQVDYAVKCTQGTLPDMDATFVIQERTRTQNPTTILQAPRTGTGAEQNQWRKIGIALARAAGRIGPEQEKRAYAALGLT